MRRRGFDSRSIWQAGASPATGSGLGEPANPHHVAEAVKLVKRVGALPIFEPLNTVTGSPEPGWLALHWKDADESVG